jgi:predicted TIM-barrel enzyme
LTIQSKFLNALHQQIRQGNHLLGVSTATGMNALHAKNSGADFVMVLNSGKFRQMGRSSLGGYLAFTNSNQQIMTIARQEILPIVNGFPTFVGLNATDPTQSPEQLLTLLQQLPIVGAVNYPTVTLIDGQFREALTEQGATFAQEMVLIKAAHERKLCTAAFVTTPDEAILAAQIPTDIICIHLGLTEGGLLGARRVRSFTSMIKRVNEICQALKAADSHSFLMIYGGIINDLTEVRYLYNRVPAIQGYIGGSTFERLIPEQTISEQMRAFKSAETTASDTLTVQILEGAQNYYTPADFIKRYIDENYAAPVYIGELADMLHMSASYLSTLFKKKAGVSFTTYLIRFRLNKAVELIKSTSLPLKEIAQLVGYSDYAQFNKVFRVYFGISPKKYQIQSSNIDTTDTNM